LKDGSVPFEIVDVFIFDADKRPLCSSETLKQELDKVNNLFIDVTCVEGNEAENPEKAQDCI